MKKPFTTSLGFTLIELILAISILAILLAGGAASFINYNQAQSLNTAALDVAAMLNKAKSRAQSQVKISQGKCATSPLDGYQVTISTFRATGTYTLDAVCAGEAVFIESKVLPDNISFNTSGMIKTSFLFQVISGSIAADGVGTVIIDGYGQRKNINVDESGNISIN